MSESNGPVVTDLLGETVIVDHFVADDVGSVIPEKPTETFMGKVRLVVYDAGLHRPTFLIQRLDGGNLTLVSSGDNLRERVKIRVKL